MRIVVGISAAIMLLEIGAGILFGSMALLADGLHMATHVGAIGLAAAAYTYATTHRDDQRFTFGTGKVGDLAAFASGIAMAIMAIMVGIEGVGRLFDPPSVRFTESIVVATIGLSVNILAAAILHDSHSGSAGGCAHDHNHRAAFLHVLADAFTSVLAIASLVAGKQFGWLWADAAVGIFGAVILSRWALDLIGSAAAVLLDASANPELRARIRSLIEARGDRLTDMHVWQVGPGHNAAILAIAGADPLNAEEYKRLLGNVTEICHLSVEVNRLD